MSGSGSTDDGQNKVTRYNRLAMPVNIPIVSVTTKEFLIVHL